MMMYRHSFHVQAPLTAVADFHTQSTSMGAITPLPIVVQVHHAPARLESGDKMDFTLWLGPLPVRWLAQVEIELKLRPHLLWGLVGLGMWFSLPLLFAYRGWKTCRLFQT
jgi:ligand-binding SRPBCC domain-containing protein